ncbi:MAG: tetratricopeptide (TPR) repeat protein [Paraglaciecola sp.]|jgi:tetratricopeptide (TPR) repeat protein
MKYTNLRVALLVLILSFLTACATFDDVIGQSGRDSESNIEPEKTVTQDAVDLVIVDPVVAQALLLKSQNNQYLMTKVDVPSEIRARFIQALALKQQKEYEPAKEMFLSITQSQPSLSGPWLQLAEISQLQALDSGAEDAQNEHIKTYLQQAINVNPANYFAHNRLGGLLRTEGDFAQAKNHYQLALKSWPGFAPAYLNLAILDDLYIGDKNQALEKYLLYQALVDKPERQVKGWIADLSRQVEAQKSEGVK